MIALEKVYRYLKNKSKPRSAFAIAKATGVNYNTLRKLLGYNTHKGKIKKIVSQDKLFLYYL